MECPQCYRGRWKLNQLCRGRPRLFHIFTVSNCFRTGERQPMLALWQQLILCDLDSCSRLWNPSKTGDIQALRLLQRSYLRCISGMQGLNYWEQLGELKLYSLERRWERYIAIYILRIPEGHVPTFDMTPVSFQWHPRRGRVCLIPKVSGTASSSIQSLPLLSTYKGSEYLQFSAAVCQKYYWLHCGDL